MSEIKYPYFSPDVPHQKISYSYSQYYGTDFIHAWRNYRQGFNKDNTLKKDWLKTVTDFVEIENLNQTVGGTSAILNLWIKEAVADSFDFEKINLLVKRFEVTKKIYGKYDESLRATDKQDFLELDNYLKFGCLLVLANNKLAKLQYVNALLKLNDMLCSLVAKFNKQQKEIFILLLQKEEDYINELMQNRL